MAKRRVYSFMDQKYSVNGIASVLLSIGSLVVFVLLLFLSFWMKGDAGAWIGACGVTGIVMAILGMRYGFVSFRDDCQSYFCSKCGTIISTVAIAAWFFVVCLGLVRLYFS